MIGAKRERWQELCELAATEQDPKKLMKLVEEISRMLREKQERLDQQTNAMKVKAAAE